MSEELGKVISMERMILAKLFYADVVDNCEEFMELESDLQGCFCWAHLLGVLLHKTGLHCVKKH